MITKVGNKNISQKKYFNFNENKFIYSTTTSEPTKSKYLHGDELFNALKQYNYASKYYNENLNNNKPVITDAKTLNQVLQDQKIYTCLSVNELVMKFLNSTTKQN